MNEHIDKKIENVVKGFRNISLTKAEQALLFSRVDEYVAAHPRKISQATPSPYFWSFFSVHAKGLAFIVVVFIILGSTSAAAQYSLPGEALYGIKININEEVRSFLALNNFSKAKFESKRANERLKEASVLARNGKLSETAQVEIEANFTKHVTVVQDNIKKLRSDGELNDALSLGTDLEVTLRSSEDELSAQEENPLSTLVQAVEEQIAQASTDRMETETNISDSHNDETIKAAAETKRDAVVKVLASLDTDDTEQKSEKSTEDQTLAENTIRLMSATAPTPMTEEEIIAQVKELVAQGEAYMEKSMFKEAFESFNAAFELEATLNTETDEEISNSDNTEVKSEVKGEQTQIEEVPEDTIRTIHNNTFDKKKELI